jgi:hypothetical protein
MSKFELSNAVTLFTQQTTTINSLWTVYVAATFAAAGYGFSASSLTVVQAGAVTLGFSAFAFGNWQLLMQGLSITRVLGSEIKSAVSSDTGNQFKSSIKALAVTANPPWVSGFIHLFIDACVIVALWTRVPEAVALAHKVLCL